MRLHRGFVALSIGMFASLALAQETPVGTWKTIDDASGKAKALIRITESNGVLSGRIEKIFHEPGDDKESRCTSCTDSRKDQPVLGMTILTGLKREGDTKVWSGGEILDPSNGKLYKCKATPADGGRKLDMRGYIGIPMLGRTQTWVREQ